MKNKVVLSVGWLLGILSLVACGNETGGVSQLEYVPFQTEKDGRWGLVSPDGEILYEEEFENRPTSVVNGRFMVEDGDGKWEIYVPEKPARKVGGKYVSATQFGPGSVALVTRGKNKGIEMIDKEGNVRCVLNEVVGKPVDRAYYLVFVRGGASFFTPWVVFETGGKQGCMDSEGNITVKPEYDGFLCSGKYLMAIKGGKSLDANGVPVWWTVDEGDTLQTCILDDRGKQLRSFSVFGESAVGFSDDVIYVGKVDTGNEVQEYELRTMDNEVLLKLP